MKQEKMKGKIIKKQTNKGFDTIVKLVWSKHIKLDSCTYQSQKFTIESLGLFAFTGPKWQS